MHESSTNEQDALFPDERKLLQDATVEGIRRFNETRTPPDPDPEHDELRRRNMEDGSGFSVRAAEEAVTPLDPSTIPTDGVKRVAELRRQRKPRPQTVKERNLADKNLDEAHFPHGNQGRLPAVPTEAQAEEPLVYSDATEAAINAFLDRTRPRPELTSERAQAVYDMEFGPTDPEQ